MSNMVYCRGCGKEIHNSATSCPHCGAIQKEEVTGAKNRIVTAILALCFGGFGVHKFYLGKIG